MEVLDFDNYKKTKLLVEQHFHGAYGVDFSTCNADDILILAKKLLKHGIGGFFPTLVTDSIENIKRQIEQIKIAKEKQSDLNDGQMTPMAEILGIHLEGIFINPEKRGIHNPELFLKPTLENYKLIEDDLIKIVTLAPELDDNFELCRYLTLKGVKIQAGHCIGSDLSKCHGVTHLFNAMEVISHRKQSTALSALIEDKIYTEIIADGIHLNDDILNLVLKSKPQDKIILVSDALPIAKSALTQAKFAGETIYFDGKSATSKDGTIAGSTSMQNEIIKRLSLKAPDKFATYVEMASENLFNYHSFKLDGYVYWNEKFDVVSVEKDGQVICKLV